jgi:nucleoporin NUP159
MIDTLGINARSLASFVKYHAESSRGREITREDLDEALDQGEEGDWNEEWCLAELDELIVLENELGHVLDSGRLTQVHEKLLQLAVLSQDVHKLRSRVADIKLQIQARNDPASLERLRLQPLSANVAKMQRELRDSFAGLLKRLATAEEEVVLLRTKIAGASTGGRTRTQVPTVEAVTKTIEKMTAMVTKKSGDIDVLENTLKKLNIRDSSETSELGASRKGRMRESSPFATPPRSKALVVGGQSTGRTYGLFDTPDSTPSRNGKGKETGANGEAVKVFNEKKATRKKLGALLTGAVLERGTKVTGIGV